MTRRRAAITQIDVTRIVKATAAIVGLERITGVRVLPTGEVYVDVGERPITLRPGLPDAGGLNEWDAELSR